MPSPARSEGVLPPLVLTLALDPVSFGFLDALRRRHFPAERNHLPAHVTLFQKLPGEAEDEVVADVAASCTLTPPLRFRLGDVLDFGGGAAFAIDCSGLAPLRAGFAKQWAPMLSAQDAAPFRPHVTVQNKAPRAAVEATLAELCALPMPVEGRGTGLDLWRYRGGPWEAVTSFDFTGERK